MNLDEAMLRLHEASPLGGNNVYVFTANGKDFYPIVISDAAWEEEMVTDLDNEEECFDCGELDCICWED